MPATDPTPLTTAICDPQTLLRPALEQILRGGGMDVLWSVSSLKDAPALTPDTLPDVLLLNFTDPGPALIDQVASFRADHPTVKVVAMSDHGDDVCVLFPEGREREGCQPGKVCCLQQAIVAGVQGAVRKTDTTDEFLRVIREVSRGELSVSEPTLSLIRANLVPTSPSKTVATEDGPKGDRL